MTDISVSPAGPASPEHDLEPDLSTIKRGAVQVMGICSLPRYEDVLSHIGEMNGYLRVMVPAVRAQSLRFKEDHFARQAGENAVTEAERRMGMGAGTGLQSAMSHAKALGSTLLVLCDTYTALSDS